MTSGAIPGTEDESIQLTPEDRVVELRRRLDPVYHDGDFIILLYTASWKPASGAGKHVVVVVVPKHLVLRRPYVYCVRMRVISVYVCRLNSVSQNECRRRRDRIGPADDKE